MKIVVYCARPYHSWERGLNEHTNGLLREYFPKGTDFSMVTPEELASAIGKINNRPRRSLHYRTPEEVFLSEIKRVCVSELKGRWSDRDRNAARVL